MQNTRTVLSETWHPAGFCIRVERTETPAFDVVAMSDNAGEMAAELAKSMRDAPAFMEMESAYSLAGHYIGSVETAKLLCGEYGIAPELLSPEHNVCSIGFSTKANKWYGWSHRAIHGFGIGDAVKVGDVAYVPKDWDDFLARCAAFWTEDDHINVTAERSVDADGNDIATVSWFYSDRIPNKDLRGKISSATMYPPEQWGRGEWVAETLDDAREMAKAFADDIA